MTTITQLSLFDNLEPKPKRCNKCGEWYPLTDEFWYKNKSRASGFAHECKECSNELVKKWKKDNSDKVKESDRKWRSQNHDYVIKKTRKWKADNPDKQKKLEKQWKQNNPDKVSATYHRRRARKLQAEGHYTVEDIQNIYRFQNGRCKYCNADLEVTGKHLDHIIPLSRGRNNWPTNLQYLCPHCNTSKGDKMPWEFKPEWYFPI